MTSVRPWCLVLVAVLVIAGCGSDGSADDEATGSGRTQSAPATTVASALERSAGYFDAHPPRGDVGFLIGQGSLHLPAAFQRWSDAMEPDPAVTQAMADPTAAQYLEAILWLQRGRPHHQWGPLAPPSVAPSPTPSTLSDDELAGVQDVMDKALRCEDLDAEQRQAWLTSLATPSHSYLLTHQLLSLVWGRVSGCLGDAEADPLRNTLATAVYAELLADATKVNDLSLERMAMLCYADLCDWVNDEQIQAVVAGQDPDGGWGDGSVPIHPDAFVPPEHTAGLGFYVLAMKWDPATQPPSPPA
jgi:hypothetical protein